MKLLSINTSKAIWLFPTQDLNPQGKSVLGLLAALKARYGFGQMPTETQILEFTTKRQALEFSLGHFSSGSNSVGIALTYFHDGLMIETRAGTEVGDEALADVLTWLTEDYAMTPYRELSMRKIYSTEAYVSLDNKLPQLHPGLTRIAEMVRAAAGWPNPTSEVELTGIAFGADPAFKSQLPPFRIERDVSAHFADNRYYCAGPLKTRDLLKVVEEFDSILD